MYIIIILGACAYRLESQHIFSGYCITVKVFIAISVNCILAFDNPILARLIAASFDSRLIIIHVQQISMRRKNNIKRSPALNSNMAFLLFVCPVATG